jgi:iron complex transport system ATP-binding protein
MLEVRSLHVRRDQREVLRDVSLSLAPGHFLAVLGPNGAGKSTLLDAVAGTVTPERGVITWLERPLGAWPTRELATQRGALRQRSDLVFPLLAAEVVALGRHPHGPRRDDPARVTRALTRVGANALAQRPYTALSGGERQRVDLARVLCQVDEPGLLLLDEPTSAQDVGQQQRLLALARDLAREGYAVLAILHDLAGAAAYADRLLVLHRGRVVASGTASDVLTSGLLREVFGLHADVRRDRGVLSLHPHHLEESPC